MESILGQKADQLYDSISVVHDIRWDLPLLSIADTLAYMRGVQNQLIDHLGCISAENMASEVESFIYQFGVFHEDMHTEAFLWARQTLAYPAPVLTHASDPSIDQTKGPLSGFVEVPGGTFMMGAKKNAPFLFDNEKKASFWMKNTLIPLDIIFINKNGSINKIYKNTIPKSLKRIISKGGVLAVLEINAGETNKNNIGYRSFIDLEKFISSY